MGPARSYGIPAAVPYLGRSASQWMPTPCRRSPATAVGRLPGTVCTAPPGRVVPGGRPGNNPNRTCPWGCQAAGSVAILRTRHPWPARDCPVALLHTCFRRTVPLESPSHTVRYIVQYRHVHDPAERDIRPVAEQVAGGRGWAPRRRGNCWQRSVGDENPPWVWIPDPFITRGTELIVLLCAGDKNSQRRDIERAKRMAKEWDYA